MNLSLLRSRLRCVANFRPVLETPVMTAYCRTLDALDAENADDACESWAALYYLLKSEGHGGLGGWLWDALRFTETPYGHLAERGGTDESLTAAVAEELATFQMAAVTELSSPLLQSLPLPHLIWDWDHTLEELDHFYRQSGCGLFARYRAFRWTGKELLPIPEPDSPQPWELWGYQAQRRQVADNARALLEGKRVNHVLLYGDSGTGKSATVKSLLSHPDLQGLRIIELDKDHLEDIPALARLLDGHPQKFILFLDDLAFESRDASYAQLKTILEGSLERQRDNVVIYATSNRRNLVRQTTAERLGDEMDIAETIEETTSLVQRFGVRIAYLALTPKEFLRMVADLAQIYGLTLPPDKLLERAKQWELRHPGRTPRIAKQFISYELEHQGI